MPSRLPRTDTQRGVEEKLTRLAGSRELRVAEVVRQDVTIENGSVTSYRVRLGISFKYGSES
jgi:flavin-binding protein dodecin